MRVTPRTVTKRYRAVSDVRWKGKLYAAGTVIEGLSPWDAQQIGIGYQVVPAAASTTSRREPREERNG